MVIRLVLVVITFLETAAHHRARELSNRFTISLICAHRHFHFTAFEIIGFSRYPGMQYCLGKNRCAIPFDQNIFDRERKLCLNVPKNLAIQVQCGENK